MPFLCGVIGTWTDEALHRLLAAGQPDLVQLDTGPRALLFVSDPNRVRRLRSGYSWSATAENVQADMLAAQLSWNGRDVALATDALALNELYYRRIGQGVFFASRIAPLLAVRADRLNTDWEAWADIAAFGYPVADRTPFLEVRRMIAGSAWQIRDEAEPRHETALWPFTPSGPPATPTAIAAAISRSIPRLSRRRPTVLLSGGWDSRMLAGLTRSRSLRRPITWTTSPDDGWDYDVTLAEPVARRLRLAHRVHIPDNDAFVRYATATRRRVQYQTHMHTWLSPLAEILHRTRAPLLDGLAGDVLLKSLFVGAGISSIRDRETRMSAVRASLSVRLDNEAAFSPGASSFIQAASRAGFERATRLIPDMPADATVAVLLTRTMRGIAPSPMWVFGPECDVRLPFVDPAVIEAALTVPITTKADGGYYRQVLREACADAASLPSTNDPLPDAPRSARRQSSPESLAWMAGLIGSSDDALGLLAPRMATALRDAEELGRLGRFNAPLRVLQVASMLAEWQNDFRDMLCDVGRSPWTQG